MATLKQLSESKMKPMNLDLKKGALHKSLGVPKDEKIPSSDLTIDKEDSPLLRKRKQFAINAKKWHHESIASFAEHISIAQKIQDAMMYEGYELNELINEAREPMSKEDFEHKRNDTASKGISGLFKVYGPSGVKHADGHIEQRPPTEAEHKEHAERRFKDLDAMNDNARKSAYHEASTRIKSAGRTPDVLTNNTKTDTASTVPGHGESGKNGHISFGMSGSPDTYRFHKDASGANCSIHNNCPGKTDGCVGSCLAKQGRGKMASLQGLRDASEQSFNHNEKSREDHLTMIHKQLHNSTQTAKKQNKHVLVRPDVSTGSKHNRLATAISNSFGPNSDRVKSGKHAPVIVSDYSKSGGTHDPKNGIYATHSDLGPAVHKDENGQHHIVKENVNRRKTMQKEHQQEGKGSYTVFNRSRPGLTEGPESTSERRKEYDKTMGHLHTVRRYELEHSEPNEHEKKSLPAGANPREYHHPEGYGRVATSEGKSYKYQDHPVADKHHLTTGKTVNSGDTDARYIDKSSRHFKTHPDEQGKQHEVGVVTPAFATPGTKHKALKNSTMFHNVEDIDKHGIYHDSHPDQVNVAMKNQKKVIPISKAPIKESEDDHSLPVNLHPDSKLNKMSQEDLVDHHNNVASYIGDSDKKTDNILKDHMRRVKSKINDEYHDSLA